MSYHMTLQAMPANASYGMKAARHHVILDIAIQAMSRTVMSVRYWYIQRNRMASLSALPDHTLSDIGVPRTSISPAPCAPATPIRRSSRDCE